MFRDGGCGGVEAQKRLAVDGQKDGQLSKPPDLRGESDNDATITIRSEFGGVGLPKSFLYPGQLFILLWTLPMSCP